MGLANPTILSCLYRHAHGARYYLQVPASSKPRGHVVKQNGQAHPQCGIHEVHDKVPVGTRQSTRQSTFITHAQAHTNTNIIIGYSTRFLWMGANRRWSSSLAVVVPARYAASA